MRSFDSFDSALIQIISDVMNVGGSTSPRGIETQELQGYSFRLENPLARRISIPARRWSFPLAIGELCWHLTGSSSLSFIRYYAKAWERFSGDGKEIEGSCYGKKIFGENNQSPSQWTKLLNLLKNDPESRRAVLTFQQQGEIISLESLDIPCVSTVQFLIRDNKVNCITTMRSNDVIWGLCYDVFFLTMLQELLCKLLGRELGWYQHVAGSLHIYNYHYDLARKILDETIGQHPDNVMLPMTDIDYLETFLIFEKTLRETNKCDERLLSSLPEYWQNLAHVLVSYSKIRSTSAA